MTSNHLRSVPSCTSSLVIPAPGRRPLRVLLGRDADLSHDTPSRSGRVSTSSAWLVGMSQRFLRYQSPVPDSTGIHLGIFALANRLAKQGRLSPEDWASWRSANDYYDAAYPTPAKSVYDPVANPAAQAWFKSTAQHLLARVDFYVDLLRRYDVACELFHSDDPGRVVYEEYRRLRYADSTVPV